MQRKNRSAERIGIGILAAAIVGVLGFVFGAPLWMVALVAVIIVTGAIFSA